MAYRFINKQNLEISLEEGELGESYGYNMRTYNGTFDQLKYVLELLQNNPFSRRIIINLWNPSSLKKTALPPCLMFYQFYVRNENNTTYLDCQCMNRSSDILVAGDWNIATASLFTYILAKYAKMPPGKLIWITGDTHIYLNNKIAAQQLLSRRKMVQQFPLLLINKEINTLSDILNLEYADITLLGYNSVKPQIKMNMNA